MEVKEQGDSVGEVRSNSLERAKNYQREQLQLQILEELATIVFLIIWVWVADFVVDWLTGFGVRGVWLLIVFGGIIYLSYQVALFIFDYLVGYKLEHKYELSTEQFNSWLWRHFKVITLSGLFSGVLLIGLYLMLWNLDWWYLWGWLGWIVISVLLAQVFPILVIPIFYPTKPIENEGLLARLRELAGKVGLNIKGIYSIELSKSTRKGNAMLAGLGKTRRVLLSDTLLDKLSEDEIEVVFAHELGHHKGMHFLKMLIVSGVATVVLFGLIYLILGKYNGANPEMMVGSIKKLPVLALVMSLFTFTIRPILYAVSRYFEVQSDKFALEETKKVDSFISAFDKLTEQNLADPNPSRWVVIFYYDHPPISERIRLAEKYK